MCAEDATTTFAAWPRMAGNRPRSSEPDDRALRISCAYTFYLTGAARTRPASRHRRDPIFAGVKELALDREKATAVLGLHAKVSPSPSACRHSPAGMAGRC